MHDILRSPAALHANGFGHVRASGQVVAGAQKWVPRWRPSKPRAEPLRLAFRPRLQRQDLRGFRPALEPTLPADSPYSTSRKVFVGAGLIAADHVTRAWNAETNACAKAAPSIGPAITLGCGRSYR